MDQETLEREADDPLSDTGPVLIASINPTNFLSFGPGAFPIALRSLNVLIGANGSGKSNLIEAIAFLRAAPKDFQAVTRQGGGVTEWIHKGSPDAEARIQAAFDYSPSPELSAAPVRIITPPGLLVQGRQGKLLTHTITFGVEEQAFQLRSERVEKSSVPPNERETEEYYMEGNARITHVQSGSTSTIHVAGWNRNVSMVALLRDPNRFLEFVYLASQYSKIRVYRGGSTVVDSILRMPQSTDAPTETLEEDFSNLKPFLRRLWGNPESREKIRESLRDLLVDFEDLVFESFDEQLQLYLVERGKRISARRLSDGTLRYLALLAILCDPTPPPLICIEEPEMGLHTDLIPGVARLLVEAAQRTQIIITTHSDILVDALTETLEAVLVCEKNAGQTEITRLNRAELSIWLDKYRLGELWLRGEIGGKRW